MSNLQQSEQGSIQFAKDLVTSLEAAQQNDQRLLTDLTDLLGKGYEGAGARKMEKSVEALGEATSARQNCINRINETFEVNVNLVAAADEDSTGGYDASTSEIGDNAQGYTGIV